MSDQVEDLEQFARAAGMTGNTSRNDAKPVVIVPGGSVSVSASAEQLYTQIARHQKIFVRDGVVHELTQRNSRSVLQPLKPARACSVFEQFVDFKKVGRDKEDKPTLSGTTISKDWAEKYLTAPATTLLPEIKGIINCPVLVERGKILHVVQGGYDAATGILVTTPATIPSVSREDAVFFLTGILQEIDFQTPGDWSRAIASLITPALRFGGFIKGPVPADIAEADQSQAGKTHRQKLIAALYNEEVSIVVKKEAGVGSLDEAFGSALSEGRPFIQLDNIRGKLNSQQLESFLTATGPFPARPAYSKVIHVDPTKYIVFINSNGYQATVDLSNRSSIIRIKKREGFQYKDMLGFVKQAQPRFLGAVFRVVQEWFDRGKPRTNETRHDFREWCQTLDWIVQDIFGAAPLMDGHKEAQQRVSSPEYTFLRAVALEVASKNRLKQPLRASDILTLAQAASIPVPGLAFDKSKDTTVASMAVGKALGQLFTGNTTTVTVEDFTVTRHIELATGDSDKEFESKSYSFNRSKGSAE